jgi:septal ring factor EnvC (AmiA/AmiB activator)
MENVTPLWVTVLVPIICALLGSSVIGGIFLWFLNRKKFNAEVGNTKALTKNTDALTENTDAQTAKIMVEVAANVTKQVNEHNSELQEHIMQLEKELGEVKEQSKQDRIEFEKRLSDAECRIKELEDEKADVEAWANALVRQVEEAGKTPVKIKRKTKPKTIQEGKDG